jgi:hypothetical protein
MLELKFVQLHRQRAVLAARDRIGQQRQRLVVAADQRHEVRGGLHRRAVAGPLAQHLAHDRQRLVVAVGGLTYIGPFDAHPRFIGIGLDGAAVHRLGTREMAQLPPHVGLQ